MIELSFKKIIQICADQLQTLLTNHSKLDHIHVAYSGGMDSHILLLIAKQSIEELRSSPVFLDRTLSLSAIHINHQLNENSNQWQKHCEQVCADLQIPLLCEAVTISMEPGVSLEEQARVQRYQVFEKHLTASDLLLMAHHQDDQMETMLMRLLKGAGPTGLAGIPKQRAISGSGDGPVNGPLLLRPLLDVSRKQLLELATLNGLKWIEDPSNRSTKHDRNYLRHSVLPLLEQRWPGYRKTWSRTAGVFSEYAQLADQVAVEDYRSAAAPELFQLRLLPLLELDRFRQKNLIRLWLSQNELNNPEHGWVETILDEVATAVEDATPIFEANGWQVRRFNGLLHLLSVSQVAALSSFDRSIQYEWDLQSSIMISNVGVLSTESLSSADWLSMPELAKLNQGLRQPNDERITVRFRQGGERCQPAGRSGSRPLKKLFNEHRIEPWLRDCMPLIYFDEELAAVPNCFVCESYQSPDQKLAVQLKWTASY